MLRGLEVECALRESRDARENLVGGLRPHERLGMLLMRVDELPELDRAMPLMKLRNDLTRLRVEGGEQRGCAVPIVVMRAALDLAGPHRQERLGAIQRLDLW